MVKRVQRYGLTSGAMAAFTGLVRELIVNTTRNSIHVHDGVTAGGVEAMRADGTNGNLATSGAQGLLSAAGYNVVNGIGTLPVPVLQGGTGGTTASAARTNLGLGTAAVANTGTSGANVPFFNGANSWSNVQTLVSFPINEAQGADIASATNPALGAATGNYVNITGTTTIAGFDTIQAGTRRKVKFAGILQLTYNATSFILPGAANITTAAGDQAEFVSLGGGNWVCTNYQTASGKPVANGQIVSVITSAVATGTTAIPMDDTIPQNTEGDQYLSATITPKSATSTLIIEITAVLFNNGAAGSAFPNLAMGVALFQDATANALAAVIDMPGTDGTNRFQVVSFRHKMVSGTTSATTFKVRAGSGSASNTVTFNGQAGSRLFGGVMSSSITITEVP